MSILRLASNARQPARGVRRGGSRWGARTCRFSKTFYAKLLQRWSSGGVL